MVRIIGVVSGKGGVGKTTIVSNLGAVLSQQFKKKVTIVDCNVTTSHLGLYLGIYYSPITLNKVLTGESKIEDAIYEHFSGMMVVPASLSLRDLEGVDLLKLRDSLVSIFDKNDFILLDAAPGFGREALAAFRACDELLFVTTPYVPSVMDIVRCQELANEIGVKPIGIVLNMVNKEKYELEKSEVEQLTGLPVIATIPYDKSVLKSLAAKVPITFIEPNSKPSKHLRELAAKLTGEEIKRESIFSKLLKKLRFKTV